MYVNNSKNIPDYDHPFNVTIINDNSSIDIPGAGLDDRVNYLCVFVSGKGRDNKLLKMTSKAAFINEFGKPNIFKYGQPILNAHASINDAYSHAYCMRVMPLDACYANIIVSIKYKINGENLEVKLVRETEMSLNNKNQLNAMLAQRENSSEDEAGYKTVPLLAIQCQGRGQYGNSLRIRFTNIFRKKTNIDYRHYRLEILDVEEGNNVVETFDGCLYDYAINSRSMILSDVLDGDISFSNKVSMVVNEDAFEKLYDEYASMFGEGEVPVANYRLFDPIFGVDNNKVAIPNVTIITDDLALDRLDGVPLMGGNDGAFENGIDLESELLEDLYVKAFAGELDRTILSTRRVPVKFMLDAAYPLSVKRAMVELAIKRYSSMVYLDAGIISTPDEALVFGEDTSDLNYRIVSKGFQCYQIRDPYNGKKVDVTYTYHLASQLARHIELYGSKTPFTGEAYAVLTGAVKNSLIPVVDEMDEDLKEKLYDLRLNYYEALAENVFARGTQQTAQDLNSDLSEEHNMWMTLEIKEIAEKETIKRRYNFAEPEDRQLFSEILNERVRAYKDDVRELSVLYDMTAEEEARSVLHCYVEITFKSIAKSSIVEININPRVSF